ncbi:MAG TPA: hypothetical protein VHX52_02575 [Steroidobacteraceae bacterium]|jgi:hypothetical protein|nr:hypothetical protein [Steroidobacteraceae bacterium]
MQAYTSSAPRARSATQIAARFAATVLRAVTWKAILLTQSLGLLFALCPWLEYPDRHARPHFLLIDLIEQALAALFVMLAAFAGDEAVPRGWTLWRAFVVVTLCAAGATALAAWAVCSGFGLTQPHLVLRRVLDIFFDVGAWGTALMTYLNRQSAERILAGVRAGELARLTAERRLLASRLAAAETQVDPASVLRQLAGIRDRYAAGQADADRGLDQLIDELRVSVARGMAAAEGISPVPPGRR